jgi:hypothetical protein
MRGRPGRPSSFPRELDYFNAFRSVYRYRRKKKNASNDVIIPEFRNWLILGQERRRSAPRDDRFMIGFHIRS